MERENIADSEERDTFIKVNMKAVSDDARA